MAEFLLLKSIKLSQKRILRVCLVSALTFDLVTIPFVHEHGLG